MSPLAQPYPTPSPSIGSPATVDPNVIFDRSPLAIARSQRILQSFLSTPHIQASNAGRQNTEGVEGEAIGKCVDEFTADPELYAPLYRRSKESRANVKYRVGFGAKVTNAQQAQNEQSVANERLKRQILGKDWKKRKEAKSESVIGNLNGNKVGPKPMPQGNERKADSEDEDEEGGRSSLGARRRSAVKPEGFDFRSEGDEQTSAVMKKRGTYLDEVLSARRHKKRKLSNFS